LAGDAQSHYSGSSPDVLNRMFASSRSIQSRVEHDTVLALRQRKSVIVSPIKHLCGQLVQFWNRRVQGTSAGDGGTAL
jgi:hypothetical protein